MKTDLDRLLQERELDALVVVGPDGFNAVNASFRYFVGDAHLTGMVLKRQGRSPVLLHHDMERDAAESTGLETVSSSSWPLKEIFDAFPKQSEARVELYRRIFQDLGISGRVAVTGVEDVATSLSFWSTLRDAVPGLEIVGEADGTVLEEARLTKDAAELAVLERVARAACGIVEHVRSLLAAAAVVDGVLADEAAPLSVGRLRAVVRDWMHERELEAPEGFILSTNRDAGVPHSTGDDAHLLAPGDVILFDFFPKGAGGYHHDVTRTWCLGAPRPDVRAAFDDVLACFAHVLRRVGPGASTRELQLETCAFFERRGHATIRQDPSSTSGYVHSLGHGLGLDVHERPHFPSFRAGKDTRLEPGMVVTIEPGLYYPERDFGVRIEDTVVVTETGARSLSTVLQALEIPLAGVPVRVEP